MCRIVFEVTILVPWVISYLPQDPTAQLARVERTGPDCRGWQYHCTSSRLNYGFMLTWACLFMLYTFQYFYYTVKTRLQLKSQPYSQYRAANILLQLQVGPRSGVRCRQSAALPWNASQSLMPSCKIDSCGQHLLERRERGLIASA